MYGLSIANRELERKSYRKRVTEKESHIKMFRGWEIEKWQSKREREWERGRDIERNSKGEKDKERDWVIEREWEK